MSEMKMRELLETLVRVSDWNHEEDWSARQDFELVADKARKLLLAIPLPVPEQEKEHG